MDKICAFHVGSVTKETRVSKKAAWITAAVLMVFLPAPATCQPPPRFLQQPRDVSVMEGHVAVINCRVSAPDADVQWTKSGFALGQDRSLPGFDRYSIIGLPNQGEHHLQIRGARTQDEGRYVCLIMASQALPTGRASPAVNLSVIVPPERPSIIEGLHSAGVVPVTLHTPTNVTCRADRGKPAADIEWYLDGQRLTRSFTYEFPSQTPGLLDAVGVLTFNATMQDRSARLECRAQAKGMARPLVTFATLDVQYPPMLLLRRNASGQLREGMVVTFSCSGSARPSLVQWRWYLDDAPIAGAHRSHLTVTLTPRHHAARLECEGTNTLGSSRVGESLDVLFNAVFTRVSAVVSADVGQRVKLECEVTGNPKPMIKWQRPDIAGVLARDKKLLRINPVRKESFGVYQCVAVVKGFSEVTRYISLVEKAPPVMAADTDQLALSGSEGAVECKARSLPKPRPGGIVWYMDGKRLFTPDLQAADTHRVQHDFMNHSDTEVRSVLLIKSVSSEDFGRYNCSVTNEKGTASIAILLKEKYVFPTIYIIMGSIGLLVVLAVLVLVCCLYKKYKSSSDQGSVLGSYTDTDSGHRDKADSPTTLMGQLRQDYNKDPVYRFSADYDDMPYKEPHKDMNNGYGYIEAYDSDYNSHDPQAYDVQYAHQDEVDRFEPVYPASAGYSLNSFRVSHHSDPRSDLRSDPRVNGYDPRSTPPSTLTRITPPHPLSDVDAKLATDV